MCSKSHVSCGLWIRLIKLFSCHCHKIEQYQVFVLIMTDYVITVCLNTDVLQQCAKFVLSLRDIRATIARGHQAVFRCWPIDCQYHETET
jgi:hypothetical protein